MLHGVAGQRECAPTCGTRSRQRRVVLLVDVRRRRAMRLASIRGTGLPAWAPRRPARGATGKGRGLSMQRATRLIEVVLEPVDLVAQLIAVASVPIAIPIRAFVLPTQPLVLALQSLEFGDQFLAGGCVPSRVHAPVMARSPNLYKYKSLDLARRCVSSTVLTR